MAGRRNNDMVRVHIWMKREHKDRIDELWGKSVGFSGSIQRIIEAYLRGLDARVGETAKAVAINPQDLKLDQ